MVDVKETEKKITAKKRTINVKNVAISNNALVDVETGENNVLEQISESIPDGVESFNFKIVFEIEE